VTEASRESTRRLPLWFLELAAKYRIRVGRIVAYHAKAGYHKDFLVASIRDILIEIDPQAPELRQVLLAEQGFTTLRFSRELSGRLQELYDQAEGFVAELEAQKFIAIGGSGFLELGPAWPA